MDDKIVFDIETKNSFFDVGGKDKLSKLEVSVVGTYSYKNNEYKVFDENEFDALEEFLRNANPLIGYNSKSFDVPVLNKYFKFNLEALPQFDILEEIRLIHGKRITLDQLGKANLGIEKSSHGLEATKMYERGDIEELKKYCIQDVKITKEIFDLIKEKESLLIPSRDSIKMKKIDIKFKESQDNQERLI